MRKINWLQLAQGWTWAIQPDADTILRPLLEENNAKLDLKINVGLGRV